MCTLHGLRVISCRYGSPDRIIAAILSEFVAFFKSFGRFIFYVSAGVNIVTIFCFGFLSKMLQNSFWGPWGLLGLLGGSRGGLLSLHNARFR